MSIDPSGSTPLYQQITDHLRQQIDSGRMPAGTRLPPFRQLAEEYRVSIMTIHKALAALVSEGVIHSRVGRGSFVAETRAPHRARLLGFVLRDLHSPYFSLIARGAQRRADQEGYGLLFSSSGDREDKEDEQIQRFRSLGVDGLIIASMNRTYRVSEAIRALHRECFPFVMVSYTEDADVPYIGAGVEQLGYLATRHLLAQGRRRIGYVNERSGGIAGEVRRLGYHRALREAGLEPDLAFEWAYPFQGEWNDYRSGFAVGQAVASLVDRPDGLFVFNDLGAIGLQDALLQAGVRVPEEIAVVGVDDIEQSARARVPLTTVRQPTEEVGARAVEYLVRQLDREGARPPLRELLTPQLVVRRSCGATAPAPGVQQEARSGRMAYAEVPDLAV